jgi:hypothetical protein
MYFQAKNTFKNNHYQNIKKALKLLRVVRPTVRLAVLPNKHLKFGFPIYQFQHSKT